MDSSWSRVKQRHKDMNTDGEYDTMVLVWRSYTNIRTAILQSFSCLVALRAAGAIYIGWVSFAIRREIVEVAGN